MGVFLWPQKACAGHADTGVKYWSELGTRGPAHDFWGQRNTLNVNSAGACAIDRFHYYSAEN